MLIFAYLLNFTLKCCQSTNHCACGKKLWTWLLNTQFLYTIKDRREKFPSEFLWRAAISVWAPATGRFFHTIFLTIRRLWLPYHILDTSKYFQQSIIIWIYCHVIKCGKLSLHLGIKCDYKKIIGIFICILRDRETEIRKKIYAYIYKREGRSFQSGCCRDFTQKFFYKYDTWVGYLERYRYE